MDFCAPVPRPLDGFRQVQRGQLPLGQQPLAGHPNVTDLMAPGRVDQLRERVIHRFGFRAPEINSDHISRLAGLQRSGFAGQP